VIGASVVAVRKGGRTGEEVGLDHMDHMGYVKDLGLNPNSKEKGFGSILSKKVP
jgi:hypothetical protein